VGVGKFIKFRTRAILKRENEMKTTPPKSIFYDRQQQQCRARDTERARERSKSKAKAENSSAIAHSHTDNKQ